MSDWIWKVRCYYNESVKRPKQPGALAIETIHKSDHSKNMEVAAAEARSDLGKIEVVPISRRN